MNFHKAVIGILNAPDIDYRALVLEIAQSRPAAIVRANTALKSQAEPWRHEVIDLLKSDQCINAIRCVREHTGWTLKDAKEYCDRMRAALGIKAAA